ncbi:MAG: transcription termination/antitermination factor NusG [Clostridiales bacterium]|nr:transcription termination/antitermination factor NusG [Clostridiales bacterium]
MSESAKWYAIHTYSGYENKVAESIEKVVENRKLQDLITEIKIPVETVTEIRENKTVEVERKLFPSYVLVKMVLTDESWYIVRNTRGCTGFVGPGSKPIPLSDAEVDALGVEKDKIVETNIKAGDTVRISGDPFDGMIGKVKSIDLEEQTAELLVSMFGRETPISIPLTQIAKVEN